MTWVMELRFPDGGEHASWLLLADFIKMHGRDRLKEELQNKKQSVIDGLENPQILQMANYAKI